MDVAFRQRDTARNVVTMQRPTHPTAVGQRRNSRVFNDLWNRSPRLARRLHCLPDSQRRQTGMFVMQRIGWIVALLIAAGWVASEIPANPSDGHNAVASAWRRTSEGWQQHSQVAPSRPRTPPPLSPLVVAGLELLLAGMALLAFSPEPSALRCRSPKTGG